MIGAGFNIGGRGARRRPCGPRKALAVVKMLRKGEHPSVIAQRVHVPRKTVDMVRRHFRIGLPLDRLVRDRGGLP
jgi:hypothetical protein